LSVSKFLILMIRYLFLLLTGIVSLSINGQEYVYYEQYVNLQNGQCSNCNLDWRYVTQSIKKQYPNARIVMSSNAIAEKLESFLKDIMQFDVMPDTVLGECKDVISGLYYYQAVKDTSILISEVNLGDLQKRPELFGFFENNFESLEKGRIELSPYEKACFVNGQVVKIDYAKNIIVRIANNDTLRFNWDDMYRQVGEDNYEDTRYVLTQLGMKRLKLYAHVVYEGNIVLLGVMPVLEENNVFEIPIVIEIAEDNSLKIALLREKGLKFIDPSWFMYDNSNILVNFNHYLFRSWNGVSRLVKTNAEWEINSLSKKQLKQFQFNDLNFVKHQKDVNKNKAMAKHLNGLTQEIWNALSPIFTSENTQILRMWEQDEKCTVWLEHNSGCYSLLRLIENAEGNWSFSSLAGMYYLPNPPIDVQVTEGDLQMLFAN
jgi:hypothetical protein